VTLADATSEDSDSLQWLSSRVERFRNELGEARSDGTELQTLKIRERGRILKIVEIIDGIQAEKVVKAC